MDEKIRLRQIPTKMRGFYRRRSTSRASAVTAFCLECVGWVRQHAVECTDTGCPLYPWRPGG